MFCPFCLRRAGAGAADGPACALTVPEALELLEERYYFDIPESAYEAGSLDELFQQLGDPYTYYMSREEYEAFTARHAKASVPRAPFGPDYAAPVHIGIDSGSTTVKLAVIDQEARLLFTHMPSAL